jgi:hypothetical protein
MWLRGAQKSNSRWNDVQLAQRRREGELEAAGGEVSLRAAHGKQDRAWLAHAAIDNECVRHSQKSDALWHGKCAAIFLPNALDRETKLARIIVHLSSSSGHEKCGAIRVPHQAIFGKRLAVSL